MATILPPVPYVPPSGPIPPDAASALANLTAWAQGEAFTMNLNLANGYVQTVFANWNVTYQAGRVPWDAIPPAPPNGVMVEVLEGWGNFSYPQVGPPVCAVPVYSRVPPPQGSLPVGHIHIQKNIPGSQYWSAGSDDTAVDGTMTSTTTADDGATGVFRKIGFFMGNGWWLKLS